MPQKYAKIRRKLSPTLQNLIDAKIRNSEEVLLVVLMETRTLSGFNRNTVSQVENSIWKLLGKK